MKLSPSCRLAFCLLPLVTTPCVAEDNWWVSAHIAATHSDSQLTGPGSANLRLEEGAAVQSGIAISRGSQFAGHHIRLAAQAGYASWAEASGALLVLGGDYLWNDRLGSSGGVYVGPRLGVMEFDENITDQSDTTAVYGYEFGFDQPFYDGGMTLGLFYQQLFVDVNNRASASTGSALGVSVDRLDSLGIRLSWRL